mmetsp:Transcript_1898/g.4034  ORF Transcript_1898/g.4034 Transcript_1898/m.4034 type:complete len:432 (+) Transcript_1898:2391-3686(+)
MLRGPPHPPPVHGLKHRRAGGRGHLHVATRVLPPILRRHRLVRHREGVLEQQRESSGSPGGGPPNVRRVRRAPVSKGQGEGGVEEAFAGAVVQEVHGVRGAPHEVGTELAAGGGVSGLGGGGVGHAAIQGLASTSYSASVALGPNRRGQEGGTGGAPGAVRGEPPEFHRVLEGRPIHGAGHGDGLHGVGPSGGALGDLHCCDPRGDRQLNHQLHHLPHRGRPVGDGHGPVRRGEVVVEQGGGGPVGLGQGGGDVRGGAGGAGPGAALGGGTSGGAHVGAGLLDCAHLGEVTRAPGDTPVITGGRVTRPLPIVALVAALSYRLPSGVRPDAVAGLHHGGGDGVGAWGHVQRCGGAVRDLGSGMHLQPGQGLATGLHDDLVNLPIAPQLLSEALAHHVIDRARPDVGPSNGNSPARRSEPPGGHRHGHPRVRA